jgi:hypothetical protein
MPNYIQVGGYLDIGEGKHPSGDMLSCSPGFIILPYSSSNGMREDAKGCRRSFPSPRSPPETQFHVSPFQTPTKEVQLGVVLLKSSDEREMTTGCHLRLSCNDARSTTEQDGCKFASLLPFLSPNAGALDKFRRHCKQPRKQGANCRATTRQNSRAQTQYNNTYVEKFSLSDPVAAFRYFKISTCRDPKPET